MPAPSEILDQLRQDGLLRSLRPLDAGGGPLIQREGTPLWNFSSNDYLGLSRHPAVEAALIEGVRTYGAGAAASRLVSGTLPPHARLEEALAGAKQTEAALTFSSGFAAALGTLPAIAGKGDWILLDKLCHASLVDGARLSQATLRVFPHNDLDQLERLLGSLRAKHPHARILVVTESVFSMDGDLCPLVELLDLAEAHGALLLLDEAHAVGVLGPQGMGLAEQLGVQHRIPFQMGTLSKAIGLAGGYLAASRAWIDVLINRARSFLFSTAAPPAVAHAAVAALEIIRSTEGSALRRRIRENLRLLHPAPSVPIFPFILGTNAAALAAAETLQHHGFLVPAIRYPTVPRGTARLRISLSAIHPPEPIARLRDTLLALPIQYPTCSI